MGGGLGSYVSDTDGRVLNYDDRVKHTLRSVKVINFVQCKYNNMAVIRTVFFVFLSFLIFGLGAATNESGARNLEYGTEVEQDYNYTAGDI